MSNTILFLVLNMTKNQERYENIKKMLDELPECKYHRIEAVDGTHMENDPDVNRILSCRPELIERTFSFKNLNKTKLEEWKYDGSVGKSFPGLNLTGHMGAKGLIMSNLKAFEVASESYYSWYCILEDDAEIDLDAYISILHFLYHNHTKYDIILLDKRAEGFGGTAGMLYKSTIIKQVYNDLHPLSEFSITLEDNTTVSTLWDWKIWQYLKLFSIKSTELPCIESGKFESTIS